MGLEEIEVFIDENGEVQIGVHGVKGTGCLDLTKALEAALGGQIEEREMTPEAYETVQESVPDHQRLRDG